LADNQIQNTPSLWYSLF